MTAPKPKVIGYARTKRGQIVYDIYFSTLTAAEVARRHKGISRKFILSQRRFHPLRKQALALKTLKEVRNGK